MTLSNWAEHGRDSDSQSLRGAENFFFFPLIKFGTGENLKAGLAEFSTLSWAVCFLLYHPPTPPTHWQILDKDVNNILYDYYNISHLVYISSRTANIRLG